MKHSHYFKPVHKLTHIDVYRCDYPALSATMSTAIAGTVAARPDLAAALAGWDHSGMDLDAITETEYTEAIDRAVRLLQTHAAAAAKDSKIAKVLVPQDGFMHAVIVTLPGKLELRSDLARLTAHAEAGNDHGFREELTKLFAARMVWPTQGSVEAVRLMDELPALFDQQYPKAYRALIGMDQGQIRRKG